MTKSLKLQRGVGLIELLVALLLFGTSLLAISAMQTRSLKQNHEALIRTQANIIAYDVLERVRMASPMAPGSLVLPAQNEIDDLAESVLPDGVVDLDCNLSRLCTITITWSEFARTDSAADQQPSTFVYSTRI